MGILDPDEGRIRPVPVYQDPFLRPGFKPEDARPPPVNKPPTEEEPEQENIPYKVKHEPKEAK